MQIERLLLISTNRHTDPSPVFPLALAYLSASLSKRLPELEVQLMDLNIHSLNDLFDAVTVTPPDLIGISIRNVDTVNSFSDEHFIQDNKLLISQLREKCPNVKIVVGGAGFSIFPEDIFREIEPDFGIIGEGEEGLIQLIDKLKTGKPVEDIEGLIYRDKGSLRKTDKRHYLKDPTADYEPGIIHHYWEQCGIVNLQTKRGCPYSCVYCTYPLIEGNKIRTQNPENIVSTLKKLKSECNIDFVFFTDSVFNIQNDYNHELADAMIEANLGISWGAYFTPHNLDNEFLELLKRSGLTHIEFGTESLCDETLTSYNKRFTFEEICITTSTCNKLGIHTAHFLIFGGYGDTEENILKTIENSNQLDKTILFPFFGMRIYPGTKIYEKALERGIVKAGESILEPVYFYEDEIDYKSIKSLAKKTKNRWVFPDEDFTKIMDYMRKKGVKGPLWEYLIR